MRKFYLTAAVICTLASSMMFTSCIGSFALFNKVLSWNKQVDNKFVNELVFFAFWIIPVYEVSALADILVLNSIEFWSGENPVVASTRTIEGKDGRYFVSTDKDGYTIKSENDGSVVRMNFNQNENSWSLALPDGTSKTIFTFVDDQHISLPTPSGETTVVELSDAGLYAYQEMVMASNYAAR